MLWQVNNHGTAAIFNNLPDSSAIAQGLPVDSPANVAFVVAHPLLGYRRQWTTYFEERQDNKGELQSKTCESGQASASDHHSCYVCTALHRL